MKFNNQIIRKILIRDRPESNIVALYKKLELLNAMEILDQMSGDINAAPLLFHFRTSHFLKLSDTCF